MRVHMRMILVIVAVAIMGVVPGALAQSTKDTYSHDYYSVAHKIGKNAAGRNIRRQGLLNGGKAHTADYQKSIRTLEGMLTPQHQLTPVAQLQSSAAGNTSTVSAASASGSSQSGGSQSGGASSGLAQCIIQRESGGNPQAVNGQYQGEGQWDPSTWAAQGGTQYASSPLGATKAQQDQVLNNALNNGQSGAWTPYDGC